MVAPTGSGKSEVPVTSFLLSKNETLPSQMIYSLPTRTLIENLSERIQRYASFKGFSTAFHHGKRAESELFNEDIILTTIDQTVGAYTCTPLSAPIKRGNILAGAVSSAFLVFDEVHTFDPNRGLQTAITLVVHSSKLRLPFVVMSATLPDILVNKIKKLTGENTEIIKVKDEDEIKSRKDRKVIIHTIPLIRNKKVCLREILEIYNSLADKKLIVICNTVEKAQQIYKDFQHLIKNGKLDASVILIHSRFLDEDRKQKEEVVQKLFSRESKEHALLISTQVIEVGMNISSSTIISELAPIDSLIQRAGRCARWGGKGDFYVYDIEDYGPYREEEYKQIINKTREKLKEINGEVLSWSLERELVRMILSGHYRKILNDARRAEVIGTLSRAVFEGDKNKAEECVRDTYTCRVSIHDDPHSLCNGNNEIFRLQKVDMNVWVFRYKVKELLENNIKVWRIEESNISDDYTFRFAPVPVSDIYSQVLPFNHYVVPPEGAFYDENIGLVIGERGKDIFKISEREIMENKEIIYNRKNEKWVDHARKILNVLEKYFISNYNFVIDKFSEVFCIEKRDLVEKIKIGVALHDLGKLNKYWQEKIGWDKKIPLAHTDKAETSKIGVPHAPVSANSLQYLYNEWGDLGYPVLLAIAHHHSPRSQEYRPYEFINNWKDIIETLQLDIDINKIVYKKKTSGSLEYGMPYLGYENNIVPYRFYSFISKILRLSDWISMSGETA